MVASYSCEARQLGLLFHFGVITPEEIIQWSDARIAELDSPPNILVELSLTKPNETGEIITCLNALGCEAEFCEAFRGVLGKLHEYVKLHPTDIARIAYELLCTVSAFPYEDIPKEFLFLFRSSDAIDLADQGTWGDPNMARNEFIAELAKFRHAS